MPKAPKPKATAPVAPRVIPLDTRVNDHAQTISFERSYDRINSGLHIKKLVHELLSLHATRRIRGMDSAELLADAVTKLVDANMQNQAYRSRAVEIRNRLFMASAELEELQDRYWKWCVTNYSAEFVALGMKSEAAKWSFVANLIPYCVQRLAQLASAIAIADQIIGDLDACGYALLRISNAVALQNREKFDR